MQIEKQCLICGQTYMATRQSQQYCSNECRMKAFKSGSSSAVCPVCGKTFVKTRDDKMYCSRKCTQYYHRHKPQTCVVCGNEFIGSDGKKYCSKECKRKGMVRVYQGRRIEKQEEPIKRESRLMEKERAARQQGLHYADMQKAETLQMVGVVGI